MAEYGYQAAVRNVFDPLNEANEKLARLPPWRHTPKTTLLTSLNQHSAQPVATARVRGAEYAYPFAVGTIAFVLPSKEGATHRWTAYVRGLDNEDISHVVSRVQFTLHETFNNPQRVVAAPPFELTEEGWGEFEIIVTVRQLRGLGG
jgi:hypothetical protein